MSNRLITRIILRNDSTAGWSAVEESVILLKGEVGLEFVTAPELIDGEYQEVPTGKVKMKIGDGEHVWSQLPYFGGDECHVTDVNITKGADHLTAINAAIGDSTINKGDIAIVKEALIAEEDLSTTVTQKYQYTAYVYGETESGTAWKAMDGNYSADNVYFNADMLITQKVGYCDITNGQGVIPSKGKNLTQVFEAMYVKEANPTKTDPSVSFDYNSGNTTKGRYEVGEKVTPKWKAVFSKGSYTYGPDTGLTPTWEITESTGGETASTASGLFGEIQITDSLEYTITAKATYGDGPIPVTNKGNEYPSQQIKGGSKTKTTDKIYGARKAFYGAFVTPISVTDGTTIRSACTAGSDGTKQVAVKWHDDDVASNTYCSGDGCTLDIPEGATQVVVCLYNKVIKGVYDVNAYGTNIQLNNVFVLQPQQVSIPGANSYTGVNYNVYVYSVPGGLGANKYHISIGS